MNLSNEELIAQSTESRKLILRMLEKAGSGHPGGSLSIIDYLTTLFFNEMNIDPKDALKENRDRFVLSKGHAVPALYATLAYRGYFDPEETLSLRQLGSPFQGHPDRVRLPILEASTGSLGQGISVAQGLAMSARMDKSDCRIHCLIGDGETQEGQVWEAAMSIGNYGLSNLCLFLDWNRYQIDGEVTEVMDLNPIKDKFQAFKWNVLDIDGHSFNELTEGFEKAKKETSKPTVIIGRTTKGKGVSFMENVNKWHGVAPNADELKQALQELDGVKS